MSNETTNAASNKMETAMTDLHDLFNADLTSTIKMEVAGEDDSYEVDVTYEWDFDGTDDNGQDWWFPVVKSVESVDGSDITTVEVSGQDVQDHLEALAKKEAYWNV